MKKYTIRRHRRRRQTRSKKYLKTRRQRSRYGGVSKRPSAPPTPSLGSRQSSRIRAPPPSPPPSKASSRRSASAKSTGGVVVIKNGVSLQPLRNAGISKKEIKDDAQALQAARKIANFPQDMDNFLKMVISNHNLLHNSDVQIALRNKISINMFPATGRLSTTGIIFISYICGKINHLLQELSRTAKTDVSKKREILRKIKQIEEVIYLLDGIGCSWGVRPYNEEEMDTIAKYYRKVKNDEAGLQKYYYELNKLIDTYFPDLKKYSDPSHVVSSSMCRRLIPGYVMSRLPTISESVSQPQPVELEEAD
jgi:hypothetical protein